MVSASTCAPYGSPSSAAWMLMVFNVSCHAVGDTAPWDCTHSECAMGTSRAQYVCAEYARELVELWLPTAANPKPMSTAVANATLTTTSIPARLGRELSTAPITPPAWPTAPPRTVAPAADDDQGPKSLGSRPRSARAWGDRAAMHRGVVTRAPSIGPELRDVLPADRREHMTP
jgi:hypothetical protein